MRLYLAGLATTLHERSLEGVVHRAAPPFVLESFYYLQVEGYWLMDYLKSPACHSYMIDSGAFTFMTSKKNANLPPHTWDTYLDQYIEFVNHYDVPLFYELDIDVVVGQRKVELLRERLEKGVGRPCIPVWHKSRGKDDYVRLVTDYDFVAIGGISSKEISKDQMKYLRWFVETAHDHGCKVHALGCNAGPTYSRLGMDSVDNTNWNSPLRFGGHYYLFQDGRIRQFKVAGRFRKETRAAFTEYLLKEWVKYQRHLEVV